MGPRRTWRSVRPYAVATRWSDRAHPKFTNLLTDTLSANRCTRIFERINLQTRSDSFAHFPGSPACLYSTLVLSHADTSSPKIRVPAGAASDGAVGAASAEVCAGAARCSSTETSLLTPRSDCLARREFLGLDLLEASREGTGEHALLRMVAERLRDLEFEVLVRALEHRAD